MHRLLRPAAFALILFVCTSPARADSALLSPGSSVALEYDSEVFAEVVARTTLSLNAAGTELIAVVDVVPAGTFLQQVLLDIDPALQAFVTSFAGYRSVTVGSPPAGYDFALEFGGDPGLNDLSVVTLSLASPAAGGLLIDASAVFAYGFRGERVLQDTVSGAPVPEPATVLLLGTGLGACGGRAYKRRR